MPQAKLQRLNPIARQYEAATDRQVAMENAAGINTLSRTGYVMHAQEVENEFGFFSMSGRRNWRFPGYPNHDTFADSTLPRD